jgi:TonB family protein
VLRQRYLRELRQRVLEHREYPRAAQRAGLQGVVCLRLVLSASGHVSELRATCGASAEPLLQAALRAVRAAEPFRALPSALGGPLSVDLPVVFQLEAP